MTASKAQRGHQTSETAHKPTPPPITAPDLVELPQRPTEEESARATAELAYATEHGRWPEPPPKAMLEDRYDGLLQHRRGGSVGDYNGLQLRFDAVLWDLLAGTTRRQSDDEDGSLVSELQAHARERIVGWALAHPQRVR